MNDLSGKLQNKWTCWEIPDSQGCNFICPHVWWIHYSACALWKSISPALNMVLRHAKMYCLNFFNFFITTTIVVMMHASSWHSLKKVFLSLIFFLCILFGDPVWKCINYIWAFLLQHSFKCKFTSLCFLLCILVYTLCFVDIMCACNCKCAHQLPFFF